MRASPSACSEEGSRPSPDARNAVEAQRWQPERLSASFHGRDLFAPSAAALSRGEQPLSRLCHDDSDRWPDWPDDLAEIVYVDHYGNAMTGLRAAVLPPNVTLAVGNRTCRVPTPHRSKSCAFTVTAGGWRGSLVI